MFQERQEFKDLLIKTCDTLTDNDRASEAIWDTFAGLLQNTAGFLSYLYLLKNVNAFVVIVTVIAAAGYLVNHGVNEWNYRRRQEETELAWHIQYVQDLAEDRYLAKDIRIFGMQEWLRELHDKYFRLYQGFGRKRELRYFLSDAADAVLSTLRNGIAYVYLLAMVLDGKVGAAEFLRYFTAVSGFDAWVGGIMKNVSALHRQRLAAVRKYLNFSKIFRMEGGAPIPAAKAYEITFRDVTFRYPESENEIFSHLNLTIHAGEKLAVVGLNGAGKTTLVKLACGFYDPDEGEVLLNGVNIKAFNRREYYRLISGVFQDFSLLAATVVENVAQSMDDVDKERVRRCIGMAGPKRKMESLPRGYDTLLDRTVYEEAAELSGGELQRLMLARPLYKDSPIIVLDEPTAALDSLAEYEIYTHLDEIVEDRTTIYSSHRLSSCRFCDEIIVFHEGRMVQQGSHEALLSQEEGKYSELWNAQAQYYVTE